MKIGLVEITKMIEDCKKVGFDVRMSDLAYVLLLEKFKDMSIPYKILFDKGTTDKEIRAYNRNKYIKFLKKYVQTNFPDGNEVLNETEKKDVKQAYADMTFEENKDAMIKMISELKEALDEGKIEYKDYAKMVTDLRTKLNDKFSVSEKQEDQRVIVYAKFNHICEWTRKECYLQTKEFAMKHWGLIEDPEKKVKLEEEDIYNEREDEKED